MSKTRPGAQGGHAEPVRVRGNTGMADAIRRERGVQALVWVAHSARQAMTDQLRGDDLKGHSGGC
jgi:hypothetical protein